MPGQPANILSPDAPAVLVIAGPNGAGKSTIAEAMIRDTLEVTEFVNADVIARGLSAFEPERVAFAAGQIMLARLHELARQRRNFAFETTLASRSLAVWFRELVGDGYTVHLTFLWLSSEELAIARVADRVRKGGHSIPIETIRRRYRRAIMNFFGLYRPIVTTWGFYENSGEFSPRLIASGVGRTTYTVVDQPSWDALRARHDRRQTKEH